MRVYLSSDDGIAYTNATLAAQAVWDSISLDLCHAMAGSFVYRITDFHENRLITPHAADVCEFAINAVSPVTIERFVIAG